jgi:hypothetical protein
MVNAKDAVMMISIVIKIAQIQMIFHSEFTHSKYLMKMKNVVMVLGAVMKVSFISLTLMSAVRRELKSLLKEV